MVLMESVFRFRVNVALLRKTGLAKCTIMVSKKMYSFNKLEVIKSILHVLLCSLNMMLTLLSSLLKRANVVQNYIYDFIQQIVHEQYIAISQ